MTICRTCSGAPHEVATTCSGCGQPWQPHLAFCPNCQVKDAQLPSACNAMYDSLADKLRNPDSKPSNSD